MPRRPLAHHLALLLLAVLVFLLCRQLPAGFFF